MDTATLVGWIIGIVIGGAIGSWLAARRGRPVLGFVLGAILTIIGRIIMSIVPAKEPT